MLLSVDPSVNSPGVAIFNATGELKFCDRIRTKRNAAWSVGMTWFEVAKQIVAWADKRVPHWKGLGITVVYERPQVYTWAKAKGDPNDLIGLAGIGSAVVGLLNPVDVLSPTPAEWIGQIAKDTKGNALESPRARFILGNLSEQEKLLVPAQHDTVDAVGIGMWALGRLKPRRVYSNGRDGS
jgi:hypothetical protein